ncbi:phenylacetate--CoA ligase family protein [Desulfonema magnum]|uniref:Phenylacetate-coenzyme A ligase n=1 Tax=Desulfonema magnum TaxID=45655 RepID=A0A975BPV6_9BACT|nr:phenylacetate--CoA ligase [Desulfonema magnum]QTA89512.1 Putative phenylacetate-coenzyme A ligase, paaK-like [Desulfonema magnum]
MPWNEEFECMPVEQRQKFQLEKLKETVAWAYDRIPFYKNKLDEKGVKPDDIRSLEDVSKLPVTVKTDLRDNYPFGLCAVPMKDVVRVHASSGTTGKPITGPYTREDMDHWAECMARNLWAAGIRPDDIVQNAYGYGLFTGGMGFHEGATRIGCSVVPTSSGQTQRQITLLQDFKTDAFLSTPSYALTLAERAEDMGVNLRELPLRVGVFGAEPWTPAMRKEVEERMGIKAMEAFGLTELGGPGVSFDCEAQDGLHINEDYYLAEVVDPETFEPLPIGEKGELIFTSLQRKAMPMLRYRTKDITRLRRETCSCGRTLLKMDKLSGRTDDMLIISGVNIFPSQIESLLLEIPEVEPQYVLVVRKKGYLDHLTVRVEAKKEIYDAGPEKEAEIEKKIADHVKGMLGITARIRLVEPKLIERSEGKAKRIIDERPKE